jgi:hypothetical protein
MSPEQEIAQLRKEVRFLSLTFKCVFSVILALIAVLIISLTRQCSFYQLIYADLMGGVPLPALTEWMFGGHQLIAVGTGLLAVVVIVLVFTLRALWPLALLAASTLGFAVVYLLMREALFAPVTEIIPMLAS